jgi:hypothetical protein
LSFFLFTPDTRSRIDLVSGSETEGETKMTKSEVIAKMNARYGTSHTDYFMLLTELRRNAERLERKANDRSNSGAHMYSWQADDYRASYNEAMAAEDDMIL